MCCREKALVKSVTNLSSWNFPLCFGITHLVDIRTQKGTGVSVITIGSTKQLFYAKI